MPAPCGVLSGQRRLAALAHAWRRAPRVAPQPRRHVAMRIALLHGAQQGRVALLEAVQLEPQQRNQRGAQRLAPLAGRVEPLGARHHAQLGSARRADRAAEEAVGVVLGLRRELDPLDAIHRRLYVAQAQKAVESRERRRWQQRLRLGRVRRRHSRTQRGGGRGLLRARRGGHVARRRAPGAPAAGARRAAAAAGGRALRLVGLRRHLAREWPLPGLGRRAQQARGRHKIEQPADVRCRRALVVGRVRGLEVKRGRGVLLRALHGQQRV
mmetsp:Transcript_9446/g.38780  ORF Transcript_9446/g.38780 Transcript_9446/m.38780 type:complete len:269 (-) Transcript_9446:273-1079(-)